MLQGAKFDPEGAYVRRWVPELARLDARYIHAPWEAPASALQAAGVQLGPRLSAPRSSITISARARALAAFAELSGEPVAQRSLKARKSAKKSG